MTKAELRTIYKARRQNLSAKAVAEASNRICGRWQAYTNSSDRIGGPVSVHIHVFLPIQSRNEVDTWPIIQQLWQTDSAITVVTSITNVGTGTLTHVALTPASELTLNPYGIPEPNPATSRPVSAAVVDVVVVPLLVFDRQGHRVGYGNGFYDRFLAECRPDCLKVGLSLFAPVERIDDVTKTDISLDVCLTPDQTILF
ncbi:MAG: 5-formyltetrahydrofolate cyclo-ligase [Bacteroidetes bacterium]|nr:5-formyltetrahydrofolate cyclo-ligase [Fibrella sp.]